MNRPRASLLVFAVLGTAGLAIAVSRQARTPVAPPPSSAAPSVAPLASVAPAKVTVYDDGVPFADRWVVFHDADGRVLSFAKSDASGKASAAVPEGGMVTVAYGESLHHLVTITGIKSGDSLVIGEAEDEGDGEGGRAVGTARVTLPGPRAGAARYAVTLGVSETEVRKVESPLTVSVLERFVKGDGDAGRPRFRVLGEAFGPGGDPLAFAFAWADAPGDLDGGLVESRLPPWSTNYRSAEVTLANGPADLRTVRGTLDVVGPHDIRFVRPARTATLAADTALRFPVPAPLGEDVILRLELGWTQSDKAVLALRGHPEATRIDLAAELLPRVSNARVESGDVPARPLVHWTVAAGGPPADATVARLTWPATGEHVWTVVLPPTTRGPLRLPELPDVLAAWRPDPRPMSVAVALLESSEYASYDDVRAKGLDVAAEGIDDDEDGSLRWSSTGNIAF